MSSTVQLIIFIIAILVTVIVGLKTKTNIGIMGITVAFLVGMIVMNQSPFAVISNFPATLMVNMILITFFYGFASENGALAGLAERVIYSARRTPALLPIALYVATVLVATLGAGAMATPVFMSPIAFELAGIAGFNPLLALLAVGLGTSAGGIQAWTSSGLMFKNISLITMAEGDANSTAWGFGISLFIINTIFFIIAYFVLKGNKTSATVTKPPEPFNQKQKTTLAIVLVIVILLIVPAFINMIAPNSVTNWIANNFNFQFLSALGIVLCCAFKLGDPINVIKNKIPWPTIILVCGMATLIGLSVKMGVVDTLGSLLGSGASELVIVLIVFVVSALLSAVVSGTVFYPLFIPMFAVIAESTGISIVPMAVAMYTGAALTGLSPFSQGGSMALIGCKDDKVREKIIPKQLLCAVLAMVLGLIFAAVGWFGLWH